MNTIPELAAWLRERDDFWLIPHLQPDGDALGSTLALARALGAIGKRAAVVMADRVPDLYAFLPGQNLLFAPERAPFAPRAALYMDIAAADRAAVTAPLAPRDTASLDHHGTNRGFCPLSVVEPDAAATGVLTLELIDALSAPLDGAGALLIYAAIATDTGNFSFANADSRALRAAARCLDAGIDLADASRRLFRLRSAARTKLLGEALTRVTYYAEGRVALCRLPEAIFRACDARQADTEGIINFLIDTEGVSLAMLATEREGGVKFSLRSVAPVDVSGLAASFGGGGHAFAAGMTIRQPMEEATRLALDGAFAALGKR